MQALPSTVAPDVFTGLVAGERDALRRLFDSFAPSLAAAVDENVGADSATSHIIDALFLEAWHERATFTSPDALHDWLVRESQALSARELARRARLRRFEEREHIHREPTAAPHAPFDVAAGWTRVTAQLDHTGDDATRAAEARLEASKHGAAEHIAHVGEGIPRKVLVGGAIGFVALASAIFWGMDRAGMDVRLKQAIASKDAHAITTGSGQRATVKLDDGTQVTMAADDSITVAAGFNRELRAVSVTGAARFTVAPNPKLPFHAFAGRMHVVATGTTFTVSAWKDEPVSVAVQEGSVTVTVGDQTREVAAGAGLQLSADSVLTDATPEQVAETAQWADGRLVIANRTLKASLPVFRRWYLMDLRPEVKLLDRPVSISVPVDKGDSAIVALQQSANVERIWVNGQTVIVDAPPKGASATKR
ncbi:MAG: FecR domain-containing protein [Gemmatimonadaceae bacterium]|nr:FecR domain-containing protein [Gemmatimonadaceae bacterium]